MHKDNILISTTELVPNREVTEILGLVRGNTIRARHIGSDIGAGLKSLVGGEIKGYVKAMTDAREEAVLRMIKEAKDLGADAIISVRFTTSQVMAGAAEILVYGTAVKLTS
ncbi:MAG: YbjQ family protein [Parcubacteria group bacterium]